MNLKKGFTIIELIVVVAVIVVLAAIVITSVTVYINKSKDAKVKAEINTLTKDAIIYLSNPQGVEFPGFDADNCPNGCYQSITPSPCPWHNVEPPNNLRYIFYQEDNRFVILGGLCSRTGVYWCQDYTGASGTFTSFKSFGYPGENTLCSYQTGFQAGAQ
jgi:prepilin-type N-terminal cleavage/methylation domain-containing protein